MSPEQDTPQPLTLDRLVELARSVLLEQGSHVPTLIAQGEGRPHLMTFSGLPETYAGRKRLLFETGWLVGQESLLHTLVQVFFICEAWVALAEPDKEPLPRPSQHPARAEALVVASYHVIDKLAQINLSEMIRDETGQLVEVRPYSQPQETDVEAESPLLLAFVLGFTLAQRAPRDSS